METQPWQGTMIPPSVAANLSSESFDVSSFLQTLSSSTTPSLALPAVKARLASYHAAASAQLLAHVNRDYNKFVQLTTQIEGVDTMIDALNVSFGEVEARCLAARAEVGAPLPAIDAMLEKRRALRARRHHLEALVSVHGAVERCERALAEAAAGTKDAPPLAAGGSAADDDALTTLERVATRIAHADVAIAQLHDAPLAATLRPRLDHARAATLQRIQHTLAAQLTASDVVAEDGGAGSRRSTTPSAEREARLRCTVRAHLTLGERAAVARALADLVLKPFLADHLTRGRLDGGGGRNSCAGLPSLFDGLLDFIEAR